MKPTITHHGNGIVEAKGQRRTTWGFDARVNGKRFRRFGLLSRADAEAAVDEVKSTGEAPSPAGRVAGCGTLKVGAIGASAELLVCADLLQQGYDVYRSVSNNAACDVIAADDEGRLCRIEVKSAIHRNGVTRFKRHRFDRSKHDVLALVFLREQEIEYSEHLFEWFRSVDTFWTRSKGNG